MMQHNMHTKSALHGNHQNPPSASRSLATVTASVPICRIISRCRLEGCIAKCASKAPSRTPRVSRRGRSSLRMVLHYESRAQS